MNVPINSFRDILQAMEQDPDLARELQRHVLTQALLTLPAVVGQPQPGEPPLTDRVRLLTSRQGNLAGDAYERRTAQKALARAERLGLAGAHIALSQGQTPQQYHNTMRDAVAAGRITDDERVDLSDSDLILRGMNGVHAVMEISLGPDQDDLSRASRRADILARATGDQVRAVVVTPQAEPALLEQGQADGVTILIIPE